MFHISEADWTILASSPYLWSNPNLKHLSLTTFRFLSAGFDKIIEKLENAGVKLESLELDGSSLSFDQVLLLTKSPILSQIKSFSLFGFVILSDKDGKAPLANNLIGGLEDLKDDDNNVFVVDGFLKALSQSPLISQLHTLSLAIQDAGNGNGCHEPNVLKEFLQSSMLSNDLVDLAIPDIGITSPLAALLATQKIVPDDPLSPLKYGNLQKLDLRFSQVDRTTVYLIEDSLLNLKTFLKHDL